MNKLLKECALDEKCSYIDGHTQTTHYKIIDMCTSEHCLELIQRGWRRFGTMFFRPICATCTACESIKIDVKNYEFSKSARRVIRKNEDLKIIMQPPTLTQEHLDLFTAYHDHMEGKRDWDNQPINARNYYSSFVQGYGDFGYEVLYYEGETLIGVDLVDVLEDGISSIYFYYDPQQEKRSLGRLSMYQQINYAKEHNLAWIYMGYYVQDCVSLAYKSSYTPYLTLQERPTQEQKPLWYCKAPLKAL